MNRSDYRRAFDAVQFSADFEGRTLKRLARVAGQTEKENLKMNVHHMRRGAVLAAVLAAVLIVSAAAAIVLLTPKEVAQNLEDPALAAAFESEGALALNQTITSEGQAFTLTGLVSGEGLSDFTQDVDTAHTYAVVAVANEDGSPVGETVSTMCMTPLISGYEPGKVNAWTLGGGYSSFKKDGVAYYLMDCTGSLDLLADHTVYLAFYQGDIPSRDTFATAADGSISFTDNVTGPRALFTLPLDAADADPAAAAQLLANCGIDG